MSFPESLYGQKSLHSSVENWFSNAGHWSLNRGMFWIHRVIQRLIVQLCMERKKPVTPIYIEMGPGRTDSLEKTLMLGKIDGKRRSDDKGWDGWMASLTRCRRLSKLWELVMDRESCHAAVYGVAKSLRAQLSDGTELRSFGHRRLTESIIFIPICTSWNTLLLHIFFNQ